MHEPAAVPRNTPGVARTASALPLPAPRTSRSARLAAARASALRLPAGGSRRTARTGSGPVGLARGSRGSGSRTPVRPNKRAPGIGERIATCVVAVPHSAHQPSTLVFSTQNGDYHRFGLGRASDDSRQHSPSSRVVDLLRRHRLISSAGRGSTPIRSRRSPGTTRLRSSTSIASRWLRDL